MPTDVATSLPDLTLRDQSILEVDTGDPAAIVTGLVIHVSQELPPALIPTLLPKLTYGPQG